MLDTRKDASFARIRERSFWVPLIGQALQHYGVSLQHSGLAQTLIKDAEGTSGFLEQASCSLIWTEAARLSDDTFLGLRLNRLFCPTPFNALALTAQASPSIGAALNHLTRFFPVVSSQVKLEVRAHESHVELHLHPQGEVHFQHMEAVMGYLTRLFKHLEQGIEELVTAVRLNRPATELNDCARLLGCQTVTSGGAYSLTLRGELLETPQITADPFLLPRLVDTMQDLLASLPSNFLVDQVKHRIQLLLGSGDISEERIAGPLNISPRHLRRKLNQEGTSYEQLVDEVRKEAAIRMIGEGSLSLTSIAYELGFLDPSSFTRAFRRWTDMSPTAFRRQVIIQD